METRVDCGEYWLRARVTIKEANKEVTERKSSWQKHGVE